ncbi:TRAP transporter large permease [Lutibaculum baratangense]|uniref:TRAP transporter large permease protein n=1 Tax=Lutibaculum baratangense AMV1 TaxID=631454 RepID=V4REA1_9HYPH|nr:TRAP transporter large permease [Lutibaculum baratangense]ESR23724.1 TRAP-type C4-dicarboxylate transport system, large permease component [Lutibaculum baratangense AMV1]
MPLGFAATLTFLLALSVPIFVALSLPVLVFLLATTSTPPMLVIQRLFSGVDKFPLMAIPFFILAGNLMASGGLSRRLTDLAVSLVGPLPGGLAMTSVSSSMFFSAISGSSPATVVAVGKIMLPAMTEARYAKPFSIGLLMSSGSLGIVIPPSIFMIVYGSVTGVSIGALFLAGVGAGLIYGAVFMVMSMIYAKFAGLPRAAGWSRAEILRNLRGSAWGIAIPVIVLGGIYGGFFTPTEAAAVTVAYAAFVTMVVYRELDMKGLVTVLLDSAVTTAQVMIVVAAASAFAWYLTTSGFATGVQGLLSGIGNDPVKVLLVINVVVLIAGMFLDPNSIIIILVPFLFTVATAAGVDPVHLGVVLSVNAAIGMFTPPFGLNLFVASTLGITYRQAAIGSAPFILVALLALMVITYVPQVSLWLPAQVYQGIGG